MVKVLVVVQEYISICVCTYILLQQYNFGGGVFEMCFFV
jgi:preprotein translocase subunit SecG